jgi:hypothetical protein
MRKTAAFFLAVFLWAAAASPVPQLLAQGSSQGPAAPYTLKEYRRRVDQQLNALSGQIDQLAAKGAALKDDARARLNGDVQSLRGQLTKARAQWKTLQKKGSRNWLKTKKSLDAKVVQLKKSYTHAVNSLRHS